MTFNTDGAYEVELRGCVSAAEGQILAEDFLTKFIAFVEENGWFYGAVFVKSLMAIMLMVTSILLSPLKTIKETL